MSAKKQDRTAEKGQPIAGILKRETEEVRRRKEKRGKKEKGGRQEARVERKTRGKGVRVEAFLPQQQGSRTSRFFCATGGRSREEEESREAGGWRRRSLSLSLGGR